MEYRSTGVVTTRTEAPPSALGPPLLDPAGAGPARPRRGVSGVCETGRDQVLAAGGRGLAAGAIGALPVLGPLLVGVCCGGLGVGVAAGAVGGAATGLSGWWALIVAPIVLVVAGSGALRARRRGPRHVLAVVGATVIVAVAIYLLSGYVLAPAVAHLLQGPVSRGPTLP